MSRGVASILLEVSTVYTVFVATYILLVVPAPTPIQKVLYSHASMTALALVGAAIGGGPLSRYGVALRGVGRRVALCMGFAAAILVARISVAMAVSFLSASRTSFTELSASYVTWLLIDLVLLTALPEELFYRGYVQTRIFDALTLRGWGARRAWIASAAIAGTIFGVSHVLNYVEPSLRLSLGQGAALTIAGSTIVGFLLGIIRARSGCIWCPAIFHGLLNVSYTLVERSVSGAAAVISLVVGPLLMVPALRALRRPGYVQR